jgi:DNA excision repair protein ERCC-2
VQVEDFFAYESFRPSQKELAQRIHDNCVNGGLLLTEAMSGFGKTAAVLSGAVSAAREDGCRVIYTCRTKRQILRVVEELSRLQKKQRLRAASMFSKFDYCLLKRASPRQIPQESFGWYCGFNTSNNLCSYFLNVALLRDELDRALEQISYGIPKLSDLLQRSEDLHVCPYELVRLAIAQAEVAVVPYHYLFDPRAKPVLFDRNTIDSSKTILVVDEAHNIRDFLRGTQSATVTLGDLAGATAEAQQLLMDDTASSLKRLADDMGALMKDASGWRVDRASFIEKLNHEHGEVWAQNLTFELNACSQAAWHSVAYGRKLPFLILRVGDFLNKLLSSPPSTVLTKWDQTFGLTNTNPVENLGAFLSGFRSSVLVSATISPSDLFLRSLGIDLLHPRTFTVSTGPLVAVRTVIDTGVTTKYKSRTPEMYARIAGKIVSVVESVSRGVGVFAPSYSLLEPICERVSESLPHRSVISERRGLSSQEANDLMEAFRSKAGSVLFAVQGGRFSEGEDFSGDLMDATVVVGLSLPPPSPQLYAEYAFLKQMGEPDSYLMLSLLPAVRKAFQAAGRHLRNPGKKGLVFLFDRRFDSPTVKDLMPYWLKSNVSVGDFDSGQTRSIVQGFLSG